MLCNQIIMICKPLDEIFYNTTSLLFMQLILHQNKHNKLRLKLSYTKRGAPIENSLITLEMNKKPNMHSSRPPTLQSLVIE